MTRRPVEAALAEVMAREWGITDTPTHRGEDSAHRYVIACRSDLTRAAIAAALPAEQRRAALDRAEAYSLDLDSADLVRVELSSWIDRRLDGIDQAPASYDAWLVAACSNYIPTGYTPVGRWETVAPADALRAAHADATAAPARLQAAVRTALEQGMTAHQITQILGVTRQRVYQLRDGRR